MLVWIVHYGGVVGHVFISYDRDDSQKVSAIVDGLKAESVSYWWDKDIPEGQNFSTEIEDKIDQAKHVLVAWSVNSRKSIFVRGEALAALDQNKLLQTVIDGCRLPVPFNAMQATFLDDWTGDRTDARWQKLVGAIDPARAAPPPPPPTGNRKPRKPAGRLSDQQIVRAGASGAQLTSLWFIPLLMATLLGAGAWLGFAKVELPAGIPLNREDVFLIIGGGVVALLLVFVVVLIGVMMRALSAIDPRARG